MSVDDADASVAGDSQLCVPSSSLGIDARAGQGGLLLETYSYGPGPAGAGPVHAHEDYQLCLSLDFPGEYRYRRERLDVPVGAVTVMHPGEVHACRDPYDRESDTHFRVAYVPPHWLAEAAGEIDRRGHRELFVQPVIEQPDLAMSFLQWHRLHDTNQASLLTRESAALAVLIRLVGRHCDAGVPGVTPPAARRAVAAARDHLHDAGAHNLSLTELAARVHLTRYHLVRAFHAEVGLPPHAYQTQLRVHRARRLLLQGHSVADTAARTGFVDHSHLSRHFTRLVGISPGRYARRQESRR